MPEEPAYQLSSRTCRARWQLLKDHAGSCARANAGMIEWVATFMNNSTAMSHDELRRVYLECHGKCGDPAQEAFAKLCEERQIDL